MGLIIYWFVGILKNNSNDGAILGTVLMVLTDGLFATRGTSLNVMDKGRKYSFWKA